MKNNLKKTTYTAPAVELLSIGGWSVFCGSPNYGDPGEAGGEIGSGDIYNL